MAVSSAIPPLSRILVVSVAGVLVEFGDVFACLISGAMHDAPSINSAGIHYFGVNVLPEVKPASGGSAMVKAMPECPVLAFGRDAWSSGLPLDPAGCDA
jgi:hypothetical protein